MIEIKNVSKNDIALIISGPPLNDFIIKLYSDCPRDMTATQRSAKLHFCFCSINENTASG